MNSARIVSIMLLTVITLLGVTCVPLKAENLNSATIEIVRQKSKAIGISVINKDVQGLLEIVQEDGIYFIDGHFKKEEIEELLSDKKSWLYSHLFTGDRSVLKRLQSNPLVIEGIYERGEKAVLVRYQLKGSYQLDPLENCLIEVDGTWHFDGIFDCN